MTGHLSALALDALALDALPPGSEAGAHLASCAVCQARAAAARSLRGELPARVMVRSLDAIQRRARRGWLVAALVPFALAAAAVALWPAAAPAPELGVKGGPGLMLYARRDQRVFAVGDGAALAAGDELRFAVVPAEAREVMIGSVDGAGHATIYVPYGGGRSVAIDPRARTELPGSIVLDDAPGPERVFAVFAAAPFASAEVLAALERLAAEGPARVVTAPRLELGFASAQASVVFQKVAR
jgi:hypothetical protein